MHIARGAAGDQPGPVHRAEGDEEVDQLHVQVRHPGTVVPRRDCDPESPVGEDGRPLVYKECPHIAYFQGTRGRPARVRVLPIRREHGRLRQGAHSPGCPARYLAAPPQEGRLQAHPDLLQVSGILHWSASLAGELLGQIKVSRSCLALAFAYHTDAS